MLVLQPSCVAEGRQRWVTHVIRVTCMGLWSVVEGVITRTAAAPRVAGWRCLNEASSSRKRKKEEKEEEGDRY